MTGQHGENYDVLIIGAGHNGLVCACYLAEKGLRVHIVERRDIVGGAAVTEEFHPGFRNSTASYTVSLLNPKVIDDLDLYENGLKVVERDISNFWPLGNKPGEYLKLTFDAERNREEFLRHSTADAKALPGYYDAIETGADIIRDLVLETPPNVGGGLTDIWRAVKLGNKFRKISLTDQQLLMDFWIFLPNLRRSSWRLTLNIRPLQAPLPLTGSSAHMRHPIRLGRPMYCSITHLAK